MRAAGLVAVLTLAGTAFARDKGPAPAKPPAPAPRGIVRTTADGGARVDARLDGKLVAWTQLRAADAGREIVALVEEAPVTRAAAPGAAAPEPSVAACAVTGASDGPGKPRRLVRVSPGGSGNIETLRGDIPADTAAMGALDIDEDGRDELLLFRTGRVEAIARGSDGGFGGERLTLVDDPDIGAGAAVDGLGPASGPDGPRLRLPVVGALRTWAADPSRARFRTVSDAPTPFRAEPGAEALFLVGPRILPCGRDASGHDRFATEAEAVGRDRLRARLLDPEAVPEARSVTCWAKLPAPERALEQACLMVDGAPHLAVTTMSADKLSLFGEKGLRLFPLSPDRSRTGSPPRFTVTTGLNLWQPTTPELADVNGDGRSDLILAYWKGLKGSTAVLEAFLRRTDGGFDASARRTEIDVADGEKRWIRWGGDADGDGRPDLLLFGGKNLLVFPGEDSRDGRRLTAAKPSARLPWPDDAPDLGFVWSGAGPEGASAGVAFGTLGAPAVSDLDGDRRDEVVLAGNDADGGRVIVFSFAAGRAPR